MLPNHGFYTDEDRAATEGTCGNCSNLDRREFLCGHLGKKLQSYGSDFFRDPLCLIAKPKPKFKVQVYVRHGYFEYEVDRMEQALEHAEVIMSGRTYRRSTAAGDVEVHHVYKVKLKGPGLKSEYPDTFKRT